MTNFSTIDTERLNIYKFSPEFLTEKYVNWLNDPEVVKFSEQRHRKHTLETCKNYYQSISKTDNLFLAIVAKDKNLGHIGNITVVIDKYNLVADIAIVIGNRSAWGKGYGREAWIAVMNFMFSNAGMRKITAGTMSINKPMLSVMKASGMTFEGQKKAQFIVDGNEVDMIMAATWAHLKH